MAASDDRVASSYERRAIRTLIWLVGLRLLLALAGLAIGRSDWRTFVEGTGVVFTAGAMILGSYVLALLLIRHLAGDARGDDLHAEVAGPPEPASWVPVLDRLPAIAALTPRERSRLVVRMHHFVRDVRLEGCAGFAVTEAVQVTVAAYASLLALNLPEGCYRALKTVLIYPTTFIAEQFSWLPPDATTPATAHLGESWTDGTVVLAWDQVTEGARFPNDGHNVALHEFAHQLDTAGGQANGIPQLPTAGRYAAWTRMLEQDFRRLTREVRQGRPSVLDAYGATNEAEFFAVATETFFERPHELRRQYPELYEQLQAFFRQNPAVRVTATLTEGSR